MTFVFLKDPTLLIVLTLSLTLLILQFQPTSARVHHEDDDASDESKDETLKHSNLGDSGRRLTKKSWKLARRWCQSKGLRGLALISGSEDDKAIEELGTRTRGLMPGCYWIATESSATTEDLRGLVDNPQHRDTGCLCVQAVGRKVKGRHPQPRLHMENCRKRLPFLCQQHQHQRRRPAGNKTPTHARVAPARPSSTTLSTIEYVPDTVDESSSGESSMDSPVDHGKNLPLIEGEGQLNPWGNSATTLATKNNSSSTARARVNLPAVGGNRTTSSKATASSGDRIQGPLPSSQRSEFVTLIVLYSIVVVACMVLIGLCLVRCCRSFCGRSSIRYVKQVDEDDIPRFMPSSWA